MKTTLQILDISWYPELSWTLRRKCIKNSQFHFLRNLKILSCLSGNMNFSSHSVLHPTISRFSIVGTGTTTVRIWSRIVPCRISGWARAVNVVFASSTRSTLYLRYPAFVCGTIARKRKLQHLSGTSDVFISTRDANLSNWFCCGTCSYATSASASCVSAASLVGGSPESSNTNWSMQRGWCAAGLWYCCCYYRVYVVSVHVGLFGKTCKQHNFSLMANRQPMYASPVF